MKIMLADDDDSIRLVVEHLLTGKGYDFCYAKDGEETLKVFEEESPDLLILDVMMPHINGFAVCERLRGAGHKTPIIMLSAKGDIVDKSVGFNAGADDYLVKPFEPEELALRVAVQLRRQEQEISPKKYLDKPGSLKVGDLEIFFNRYEVKVKGRLVDLTSKEFEILAFMASHPGQVFTREKLLEYIWGEDSLCGLNSVTVFIRKIREKIEDDPAKPQYILTVWRVGYKFCE